MLMTWNSEMVMEVDRERGRGRGIRRDCERDTMGDVGRCREMWGDGSTNVIQ